MIPYYICTLLSCFFTFLDTGNYKGKKIFKHIKVYRVLAIIIPCLLAGARDLGIGTDTMGYPVYYFNLAGRINIINLLKGYSGRVDAIYLIIVYLLRLFTDDIFWLFFITEFICICFTYYALLDSGADNYTWMGMLVFHLLFYGFTLNLMRQFMAQAIMLWAFKFLKKNQYMNYIFMAILCSFIHKSALISLLILPIYYIMCTTKEKKGILSALFKRYNVLFRVAILGVAVMVLVFSRQLIVFFSRFKDSYSYQVEHIQNSFDFKASVLVIMLIVIFPIIIYYKKFKNRNEMAKFYTLCMGLAIIFWQLQGISKETYRVAITFWYFIILAFPELIRILKMEYIKANQTIVVFYSIIAMIAYNLYYFVIWGYNGIYPYTSQILGI